MIATKRLREVRKEHSVSQQVLADYLGVTQAALSGWETGKYKIDNNNLLRLAKYFGVTTDYLLGNSDEKSPGAAGGPVSDRDIKFALFGGDVSDEAYNEVKQFAAFIREKYNKD